MGVSCNLEKIERVRVLIVDDHTLFAEGTMSLLAAESRIMVIGIAKNGIECMDFVIRVIPDIVLLDINLPDICGIDLVSKIKKVKSETKIIMLTGQNPKGYILESINKGANGFLQKDCSAKEMTQAIFIVCEGGVHFSQGLEAYLHPVNNTNKSHFSVKSKVSSEILTARENEIIVLISKSLHNKEISRGFRH